IPAVHLVRRRELAESFSRSAELADDLAVELHLVDFASEVNASCGRAVGPGIRYVEILMRSAGHAHRPRIADIGIGRLEIQVVIPYLHASVAAVAYIDVALCIGRNSVRRVQLTLAVAACTRGLHE